MGKKTLSSIGIDYRETSKMRKQERARLVSQ